MSYFTREMTEYTLRRMRELEVNLNAVYANHGLDFRSNTGRRNAILSQMQEKAVADALNFHGEIARVDGRTGYPDVCVNSRYRELECKLTSGSGGAWSLQADYATLEKKGNVDFLYILTDSEFDSFCVLFFEGLTRDDFHPPSPGSREKARMNKVVAMDKCTVLMGSVDVKNTRLLEQYVDKFHSTLHDAVDRVGSINDRIIECSSGTKKHETLVAGKERLINRFEKRLRDVGEKISHWQAAPLQFTISLEAFGEEAASR